MGVKANLDCRIVLMLDENNIDYNAPMEWVSYADCIEFLESVPATIWKKLERKGQTFAIQNVTGRLMSHSFRRMS